jgi:hypothetical protein
MAEARKYSDEEVRAILDRALEGGGGGGGGDVGISHADLLAIGEQVGLSAEAMSRAADEALAARLDRAAGGAIKSRWRRWLAGHAGVFAVLNGLLFAVNAATTPGEWWVLFPVFFWGLAVALHAGLALGLSPSRRALDRERRRLEPPPTERSRVRVEQSQPEPEASTAAGEESLVTSPPRRAQ